MAISLYDLSVSSYLQTLRSTATILGKSADFANGNNLDLSAIAETRLRPDMLPFRFQVISVWHHSFGAIEGLRNGTFSPPPPMPDLDYVQLQNLVAQAISGVEEATRDEITGYEGKTVNFVLESMEIPFTAENFILSFSLPNFYFHATTAYDILRMAGVPLGKMDFLGNMRMGV